MVKGSPEGLRAGLGLEALTAVPRHQEALERLKIFWGLVPASVGAGMGCMMASAPTMPCDPTGSPAAQATTHKTRRHRERLARPRQARRQMERSSMKSSR